VLVNRRGLKNTDMVVSWMIRLELLFMQGTISILNVWLMETRILCLAGIFVLCTEIGEVLISVAIYGDNGDIV
jgi:hypothetical protein